MFSPVSSIILDYTQVLQIHYTITAVISALLLCIAISSVIYTRESNTKKYELSYQRCNDIMSWYSNTVQILIDLQHGVESEVNLSKFFSAIEVGRLYFPNIDKDDSFGKNKPYAYQGYRNSRLN